MRDTGNATNLFGVPPRPPGSKGNKIILKTNMFAISYPKGGQWYHYDVVIEEDGVPADLPILRNREIIDRLQIQEAATFTPRGVYDGRKNFFSIKPYSFHPMGEFEVLPPGGRQPKRRKVVKLKSAGLINMGSLDPLLAGRVGIDQAEATQIAVTALNNVVRMAPITNSNYSLKGSSFFMDIPGISKDMAKGLKLYRGYFQSVRPAVDRMLVNIDIATGVVFQPISVFDFAMKHFGFRDTRQMSELQESQLISLTRVLKGIKVTVTVGKRPGARDQTKIIKNVSSVGPAAYMFDKDGVQMSVMQYMQDTHGARVQYPKAPCVIIGRDAALPMEFLKIAPHQLLKRPVPSDLTSEVLAFSTQRPQERIDQITRGFQQLQYSQSDYLRGAGVQIDDRPLRVEGRVLAPPKIEFGERQALDVKFGSWNMLRKKMYKIRNLGCWAIVVFDPRFSMQYAQQLATRLSNVMEERGMMVLDRQPIIEMAGGMDVANTLNTVGNHALRKTWEINDSRLKGGNPRDLFKQPELIICVLPFPATEIRTAIKQWGDCEAGVPTQCVVGKKYGDQLSKGRDDQYLNNLVLKVHAKLGGTNFIPQNAFAWLCPTMVMGGDVSHPPPGSRGHPSVSAVVGSTDFNSCQYAAESHVQASREERITNLKQITMNLIRTFADANGKRPPGHILFFRDGLSEGQFGTFGRQEIQEMKDAFTELKLNPKLTFICVGKGHHVRFFADRADQDKSGNCPPGTVIDSTITHPAIWDFYLQSHPGLKGTSSPSHYTVLLDEMNYPTDKLQSVAHNLCHAYARSTRSVSIPAPVYYADIISARGRFHFSSEVHLSDDGDADYTDQHYQQAWRSLHPYQRQRMYYM
ncbi:Protein argonaute-2 [Ceratobasidium theobromae]|uniref:Protein argonaute-2 n=1 Tax=Ceratobasidium theobromae TaxID=1582974 RepID=A0A5N5QV98_9AGAM|nr:Protein argonaute-2 [Ceratobasidium theobromae]